MYIGDDIHIHMLRLTWPPFAPCPYTHPIGELDDIPEVAFYMVGPIEDVLANAEKLAQQQ